MTFDLASVPDREALLSNPRLQSFRGARSLVTGGLGFIGSNLVHALVALGSSVTVIDNLAPALGGNRFNLKGIEDRVDMRIEDVRDERAVADAVESRDFIFNLAGIHSHVDSLEDPYTDMDVNVRGMLTVLEAVRRHAPTARVVYSGSRSEYGQIQTHPVREDHPLLPTDANSVSKAAAGLYHHAYHVAFGLETVSLRLTNTYGPRMFIANNRQGFINWFVRTAVEGGVIKLYGDGSQVRDLEYVDDTVRALLLAAITPKASGRTMNLGGNPVSLAEIAALLIEVAGKGQIEYIPFPDEAKRIEIGDYVADTTMATRVLGWRPEVSLREGLGRSVRYYGAYREHYL